MLSKPVHILGAGGIGVALGWCLMRAGCDVTMVDTHPGKVSSGRKNGVTVVGYGVQYPVFTSFNEWKPPYNSYILLCTKTYDNPAILQRVQNKSCLVPVQNGFDPELDQQSHPGEGIASFVSECLRDMPITHITRPGSLHIGARRDVTEAERREIVELAGAIRHAGLFPVEVINDVKPYKAAKLMYNAAISPLAASAGVDNGELLTDDIAKRLFFALLQENYAILKHANVPLAKIGPFHPDTVSIILRTPGLASLMAVFFRPSLQGTYCSMAPDISTGRTEIDAYNGHLIRLAEDFPCPLNRAAYALVQKIVNERLPPARGHLRSLVESLPDGVLT
ncbi:MAG: ketopantoate reductase C-terminal domain-containing protein [Gammaproteobacteria bacterium]|nr:ketopantoate reductase C-terminal domain-containing protein [Gammaproteobacteria bacterium]